MAARFCNVSPTRSRTMKAIRSKGTSIEVLLSKAFADRGLGFCRKNVRGMSGTPDFVFDRHKVIVFADGDYWHGRNFTPSSCRISNNRSLWVDKLSKNVARDRRNNDSLARDGWTVLRYWESDIKKRVVDVVDEVANALYMSANGLPIQTTISRS